MISMQSFLDAVRKACFPAVWGQGVKLAREKCVTRSSQQANEVTLRVRTSIRSVRSLSTIALAWWITRLFPGRSSKPRTKRDCFSETGTTKLRNTSGPDAGSTNPESILRIRSGSPDCHPAV